MRISEMELSMLQVPRDTLIPLLVLYLWDGGSGPKALLSEPCILQAFLLRCSSSLSALASQAQFALFR